MFMLSFILCHSMWVFFHRLLKYVMPLDIQLSRGEGWDPVKQPKPAIYQASAWISNVAFFVFNEDTQGNR